MQGTIARIMTDRGYGFIDAEGQDDDLFFHKSNLSEISFFDLRKGQTVEFDMAEGRKGPEATNIKLIAGAPDDDESSDDEE